MTDTARHVCSLVLGLLLLAATSHLARASSLPPGFSDATVERPDGRTWDGAAGVAFANDGRMFVWERSGRVWLPTDSPTQSKPLIDLSNEVSTIGSLGLTGFALDPQFAQNGYLYLLYDVASSGATMGRLVRYQLLLPAGAQDYRAASAVNYASRRVLLGESPSSGSAATGCVVTDSAHGSGGLAFGSDGTLLVGCGDGASVNDQDSGSDPNTQYQAALAAGLMTAAENVGAFRAQLVDSLSGKILRLDAASGDGVASNPFYDPRAPRSPRSRVWVLGLHDPQHFSVRPGSGSTQVSDGQPGTLYIGELGYRTWESLAVAREGRANFGWPLYEGVGDDTTSYASLPAFNFLAPNPLFPSVCSQQYFRFGELISADPIHASWPNPCQPSIGVPAEDDVFVRDRPQIDWLHGGVDARWAALDEAGEPLALPLGTSAPDGVSVSGPLFGGLISIGGVWYQGDSFPPPFTGAYYHADSGGGWIKAFAFDANDTPVAVRDFLAAGGPIQALADDPTTGDLYYITGLAGSEVHQLSYSPTPAPQPNSSASAAHPAPSSTPATNAAIRSGIKIAQQPMTSDAGWSGGDIGAVAAAGSYSQSGGTFTVEGSGADIWNNADAFQFVSQPLSGDGSITARVVSQSNTNGWAKAGVMFRETLAPGATNALAAITPSNGAVFQERPSTGAASIEVTYGPMVKPPYWLRVVRAGNTFSAYLSANGSTWTSLGETTISMASQAYVGLAVSSHNNGSLSTAVFDNVTVTAAAPLPPQAPTVPTGLSATNVTASGLTLSWTASTNSGGSGVGGYYVYRNGNTTTPLATVTSPSFTDSGLSAATLYSYQVAAFDTSTPALVSAPSTALSVTTESASAASWSSGDIGAVAAAGSYSQSGGTFTVKGSGADIWNNADAFQFVSQPLSGDGSITARVVSQSNTNGWAKAGVMFRGTLAPGAINALAAITPSNGAVFQERPSTGAASIEVTYGPMVKPPYWLQVVRAGNTFSAYLSPDGNTWTSLGVTSVTMASQAYVGLAVSSHDNGTLSTAVFDNVTVTAAAPLPPQAPTVPTGLSATNVTASGLTLSWTASTNSGGSGVGGYYVYRNGNTTTPLATVTSPSFTDSGLTAATLYSYQVAAFDTSTPALVSAPSTALSVTTESASAASWSSGDIGAVAAAGSYSQSGGTFTVEGSGADIWNNADAFQFVSQPLSGDGSITARVVSQSNTNGWAKAGVMFRETLAPGATDAYAVITPSNGAVFQARPTTNAESIDITYGPIVQAPYWLRVVRTGNTFSAYLSPNGNTWTSLGVTSVTMASQAYVGLAVSSHDNGTLSSAVFDNVTITSAQDLTLTPQIGAITQWQSQQFTPSISGGATWSVDGIAGGNATVGTITSNGLYTPGSVGTHTIAATSLADPSQSSSATIAVTGLAGVYTYHNDLARDGANSQEYALTPSSVNTTSFGKLFSCTADGAIYAQPLWVAGVNIAGVTHNVVFVATEHDSLFAYDADASPCQTLWSVSLIDANHGGSSGETTVPSGTTGNLVGGGDGDITPEVGVTGTPVIDPSSGTLYVVSKSVSANHSTFYQRLHAIDITTGDEMTGSPVTIAGAYPGTGDGGTTVDFNPRQENQRPGLALVNGVVYIAWASHEDTSPWYGWIIGYSYNGTAFSQTAALNVTPDTGEGGIWMGGGAPAVDAGNNLYVLTGNGVFDADNASAPNTDYGDSLLQMNSSLVITQYFTPSDQESDYSGDHDFGSGGTAVLADLPVGSTVQHLLMGGGKDGSLFVFNRDQLGGYSPTNSSAVQQISLGHGIFSTGAYWNQTFYIAPGGGQLLAYTLNPTAPLGSLFTSAGTSPNTFGWPGGTPSVSAQGTSDGIVWTQDNGQYCTHQSKVCGPAVLHAYNAANVATELWNSGMVASDAAGNAVKFTVPTVANGKVYVSTRGNNTGGVYGSTTVSGELEIYGLKPN